MIGRLLTLADRVTHSGVWVSGAMLIVTSAIIGVDVLARKIFNVSLGGSNEIAGYALAISSAWAFSFTLLKRGHIRIDAVYNHVSPRFRGLLDLVALAGLGLFMGVLTWYAIGVLSTSIGFSARANTPLGTPLWIPQLAWVAGLCVFVLITLLLAVAAARALISGKPEESRRLIGIPGTQEEVAEELQATEGQVATIRTDAEAK
jgi:TRAP-type C4-dicarboxylate transport system permease small subunit